MKLYGGTERIVEWLIRELLAIGIRVTLIAKPGSRFEGVSVRHATCSRSAQVAIPKCDLVHYHGWLPESGEPDHPYLYTLHGNEPEVNRLPEFTACISQNHATRHHQGFWVYNGVDPNEFRFSATPGNHLLFFSKIRRRNKGAKLAVDLCTHNNLPLKMAGGSRLDLIKVGSFWSSITNRIDVLGEIGGAEKAAAFANARALLFPIQWQEPFGLVMVESMLSGTPVIATHIGSVPEIVAPVAGAIFKGPTGFEAAYQIATNLDRMSCRDYAVEHFSSHKMANTYLSLYEQILSGIKPEALEGSRLTHAL